MTAPRVIHEDCPSDSEDPGPFPIAGLVVRKCGDDPNENVLRQFFRALGTAHEPAEKSEHGQVMPRE
jgi:hypothetical protein